MAKQIHIMESVEGDWVALYVDGVCQMQGHELDVEEVLRCLGMDVEYVPMPSELSWCPHKLDGAE